VGRHAFITWHACSVQPPWAHARRGLHPRATFVRVATGLTCCSCGTLLLEWLLAQFSCTGVGARLQSRSDDSNEHGGAHNICMRTRGLLQYVSPSARTVSIFVDAS
jgi:hypothetical protein